MIITLTSTPRRDQLPTRVVLLQERGEPVRRQRLRHDRAAWPKLDDAATRVRQQPQPLQLGDPRQLHQRRAQQGLIGQAVPESNTCSPASPAATPRASELGADVQHEREQRGAASHGRSKLFYAPCST